MLKPRQLHEMGDGSSAGCILFGIIALGGFAWHKIDGLEKERDALAAQVAGLHSQLENVKEKASALEMSSGALKAQVERFSSDDWADVVPDAQEASDQVETDEGELKQATDDDE